MNVFDAQPKSAYSGDGKMEYDKTAQRQQSNVMLPIIAETNPHENLYPESH